MASDDPRQALGALIQTPAGQVFSAVLVWLGVALAVGIVCGPCTTVPPRETALNGQP